VKAEDDDTPRRQEGRIEMNSLAQSRTWKLGSRIGVGAVVGATLALAIGSVSVASGPPSNSSNPRVLELMTRATTINDFVDIGTPGLSPGDPYVFVERVFLASKPEEQIGRADGRCVLIDPAAFRFDCSITTSLPEGDIMSDGTLTLVEGATSTGAITEGTGTYRTVRGEGR
jgi:hypothetical protein